MIRKQAIHLFPARRVRYNLLDRYITDRAAGSVNGTPAEPGPGGNRLIRDVESKIAIAGGTENWTAQATPNYSEQDRVYSQLPITRAFGILVVAKYNVATINNHFPLAFVTNTTPVWSAYVNVEAGFYHDVGQFQIVYNATGGPLVPNLSTDVNYLLAILLRVVGAKWFIKGGAFVNWTKLFEHALGSATPLYIASSNLVGIFKLDNVRSPSRKFYDAPLASDSFNRADSALGVTDGAGHAEANGGGGLAWQFDAGVWAVSGNAAVGTPTLGAELASGNLVVGNWYSITATTADYFYTGNAVGDTFRATATTALDATHKVKQITLSSSFSSLALSTVNVMQECVVKTLVAGTRVGCVARLNNAITPTSGIIAYWDGNGNVKVDEFTTATTWTNLLNVVKAYATGDKLVPWLNGSAWRLYHVTAANVATLLGSGTTAVLTGNLFGDFSTYASNAIESCNVYSVGTEGQWEGLNSF